ncbi:hypothetical protein C5B86_16585 [Haloferax sp. Atlit-19N]|uniref:twin-arginine translocation signal domain-containing protein n=1 Tax=Haloferax sp. Atlit-19N TaxID=2077201 RepID=UPI000E2296AB|nr:twin-arginine translocation signal domain-containing protein [Haloferax sp. Atlit-19N]RDZ42301.1 hypothetical protein C5B86_16585 [Haloferax sp. Atlit-19N]
MRNQRAEERRRTVSRRQVLKGIGGAAAAVSFAGTASADGDDDWYNVVDEGADPTGGESINPVLDDIQCDDGTVLYFPDGEYLMDDAFRHVDFRGFELRGDNATIVPAADYDGRWLFKLGTFEQPGEDLVVEGFEFDFTADDTGLRVVQAQVRDDLLARDLSVVGQHDSGKYGPFAFDVTDASGIGTVQNIRIPDGGEFSDNTPGDIDVGPTGIIVSPYHDGKLWVRDCEVGAWPDNGLYCSTEGGRVVVDGGVFKNSNIANIRLSGDYSSIHGATVIVDDRRTDDTNQRGIRLDGGAYNWIDDTVVRIDEPNGRAISVQNDVEWARIQNSSVIVNGDVPTKAVTVSPGAGRIDIINTDIEFNTSGQALVVGGPSSADADPVYVLKSSVGGSGDGSSGRHAVRLERGNCTLDRFDVEQTGGDYRRAVKVLGDGSTFIWGDYDTGHIPLVNDADGTTFRGITSESHDDYEGMKVIDGSSGVEVIESVIHNGVWEYGDVDVAYDGNWF